MEDGDGEDGELCEVGKSRRISGWNFNEDVLQLDIVFPLITENRDKEKEDMAELESGKEDQIDDQYLSASLVDHSSGSVSSWEEGLKQRESGDETAGSGEIDEGSKAMTSRAVERETKTGSFSTINVRNEMFVHTLTTALSNLVMQEAMVRNMLVTCGVGGQVVHGLVQDQAMEAV